MVQILENQKQQNFCFSTEKRVSRPHPSLVGFRNLLWHERIHTLKKENNNNKKTPKNSGAKSFELLCLALCKQALPAHPLLAILPVLGGPAHQGTPITPVWECPALPSLCWSISVSLPCPLHQHLWHLVWQVPSPLSAGRQQAALSLQAWGKTLWVSFQLLYIKV